jgi:hypothetical protein
MPKCIICKNEIKFSLVQRYQNLLCYNCFKKNVSIINEENNSVYQLYKIKNTKVVNILMDELLKSDKQLEKFMQILLHYINIKIRKYYTFNNFTEKYQLNQVISYLLNNIGDQVLERKLAIILFSNQPIHLYKKCYPGYKIIILF